MKRPVPDNDDTVRVRQGTAPAAPHPAAVRAKVAFGAAVGAVVGAAVLAVGWLVWSGPPPPPPPLAPQLSVAAPQPAPVAVPQLAPASVPQPAPVAEAPPQLAIESATIARIRTHEPADVSIFRLAEAPQILVLDFAALQKQARMLDRIAALVERAGLPRERILTQEELEHAVKADGDGEAGFYYGHDYSAASLARFFAIADRDRVTLTPEESTLRRLLQRLGWQDPATVAAVISLPRAGADENVTDSARNAIFTHELSHGAYFSDPAYAAYVHRFFTTVLTTFEQTAFRAFLAQEGYDTGNQELVENETQAYLLFTADTRFFTLSQVSMSPARRTVLRAQFLRDLPDGWLKDVLTGVP